jgi:DNA-binding winged helix-turn-helix (wHTH) protein
MSPEVLSMREVEPPNLAISVLSSGRYIQFGPFQVDQQRQEVFRDGSRLKLQGKVYQILIALLEKPGDVVTREELRQRLWPAETHVNYDANVNTTVNKLRQALGDSPDKPLYIETIPRKGYCLLVRPGALIKPELSNSLHSMSLQETPRPVSPSAVSPGSAFSKSDLLAIAGVIGLILAGMLLGAAITRLFMTPHIITPTSLWP